MIQKKYVLLLCEDEFDGEQFIDKRRLEIASSDSTFMGQAQNIMFYTKIDGTHELSFDMNKFYFDENLGKQVKNELVDKLVNKCKIEAIIEQTDGSMKSFFMSVDKREDKKEGKVITYSYHCNDIFIEELSKTGYKLEFSDDIELQGSGMGTIDELAEKIVEGTDWTYRADKTDTLYEYTTDLQYNFEQNRYDEIYTPTPVHPTEFVREIGGFANKLEPWKKITQENEDGSIEDHYHQIYCYEETQNVMSGLVQNFIYNGDDFVDLNGWEVYSYNSKGEYSADGAIKEAEKRFPNPDSSGKLYYDLVAYTLNSNESLVLSNNTASSARKTLQKDKLYLFKYNKVDHRDITKPAATANTLQKILITNHGLDMNNVSGFEWTCQDPDTSGHNGFAPNTYYVLKVQKTINNPFFSIQFTPDYHKINNNYLELTNIEFFELTGKTEDDDLYLTQHYIGGQPLEEEDKDKILFPDTTIPSSYNKPITRYFIRNNQYYEDEKWVDNTSVNDNEEDITYLDFEEEVNTNENFIRQNEDWTPFSPLEINRDLYSDTQIEHNRNRGAAALNTIYYCGKDGKYYQYYYLENVKVNGQVNSGGMWDLALFGDGAHSKRRMLKAEKSNRFNIIQDLSELFKVWPVFEVRREGNRLVKEFWFKESCLNETFSGFHSGVNIKTINRTVESNDIVTKMYVEDIESEYATDGYVTITTASQNPLMENFCYNFRYYVEQNFLDQKTIDEDLKEVYDIVKPLNVEIYNLQVKNTELKITLQKIMDRRHYLALAISAAKTKIQELTEERDNEVDFNNEKIQLSDKDKEKVQERIDIFKTKLDGYETEDSTAKEQEDALKKELKENTDFIAEKMKTKTDKINEFENKYSQYIKEGTWSDSDYIDNDTYYYDAQKVSNTSAEPKISWSITVLDGNCFEELKEFKVNVGDKTFLVDPDFFDNKNNTYKFEILITGYKDYLDNATKNEAEVKNYQNSFEDLFQRIAAATQTLTLNEQTYDKAAMLSYSGIDTGIFQQTLTDNALTLINSSNNDCVLDQSGLTLKSIHNPTEQLRIVSNGIFISNSLGSDGEPQWKTGISADGINASVLTSGKINTSEVNIFTGDQLGFQWNSLGITAYQPQFFDSSGYYSSLDFVRFDGFGLYMVEGDTENNFGIDSTGLPWFLRNPNISNYDDAITMIRNQSTVSITKEGFKLNVRKNRNNSITEVIVGPYDVEQNNSYEEYGFHIIKNGKIIVSLHDHLEKIDEDDNPTPLLLGGWEVQSNKLRCGFTDLDTNRDYALALIADPSHSETDIIRVWNNTEGPLFRITKKGQIFCGGNWGFTRQGTLNIIGDIRIYGNIYRHMSSPEGSSEPPYWEIIS